MVAGLKWLDSPAKQVRLRVKGTSMIEVTVDTILPTRSGLRLGCTLRYGKNGPVKFVQVTAPWSLWNYHTRQETLKQWDRLADEAFTGDEYLY